MHARHDAVMTSSSVLIPDVEREYGAKVAAAMLVAAVVSIWLSPTR